MPLAKLGPGGLIETSLFRMRRPRVSRYPSPVTTDGMAMVLAKLDRARFHADEFEAKWNWYYHSGAYRYDMRMDEQSPHALRFLWNLPERTAGQARAVSDLSFIYGDMLSNLR